MNKVLLIIKREYLSRITKKTFILSTILTPLFFIGITVFSVYMSQENAENLKVGVYDESGLFASRLKNNKNITYTSVPGNIYDSFAANKPVAGYSGVLHIPSSINVDNPDKIEYVSDKQLSIFSDAQVEDDLNDVLEQERMIRANIDTLKLSQIKKNPIAIGQKVIGENADSRSASSGISYGVGYVSALLIYLLMFIYGSMVMRGIMEEKMNRVAEVMISSVKPIQLMMGKIIGIGAVGLTQFLIWVILIVIGNSLFVSSMISSQDAHQVMTQASQSGSGGGMQAVAHMLSDIKGQFNIGLTITMFIFYFITGYLFYASLFAAVGSAVNEDPQDAQSMMFPITIPIIISIVIMSSAITNPTGSLAVWASIIPFTSPVIMMARLPFGVPGTIPYWQLGLSMLMMIVGFLFTTWLCARIYRVGILMYGKKPSWKEMLKWVFIKS